MRAILGGIVALLLLAPAGAQAGGIATINGNAYSDNGVWDYDDVFFRASGDFPDNVTVTDDGGAITVHDPGAAVAGIVDAGVVPFIGIPPNVACTDDYGTRVCTDTPLACTGGYGAGSCSLTTVNTAAQPQVGRIVVDGGSGDDRIDIPELRNSIGNTALGGEGDDDISAGSVIGGPGADAMYGFVIYDDKSAGISASDDGIADDGEPGERDNIAPGSYVEGTAFGDRIDLGGSGWAYGDGGDDVISVRDGQAHGGDGADHITATGTGFIMGDDYSGPGGDDTIDLRNGLANTVMCGPGDDTVLADALDDTTLYRDCEHVTVM
jgi:hypothetical protein